MYHFVCFILLVSLEGLKANNTSSVAPNVSLTLSTNSSTQPGQDSSNLLATTFTTMTTNIFSSDNEVSDQSCEQAGCLIDLENKKEMALWLIIASLLLICLLLLVIIMCLACKCCQGTKNDQLIVMKSSTTRRNSVNGGLSETDIMLKDCGSVKVEIETNPDEPQEPEEVGEAAAEVGNEVSAEENKNSANDTSETAPTQKVDQSGETDLKMEDLEKAE